MHLNHLGLLVADLNKARHFYTDILGFKEIERPEFLIPGIWYSLGSFQLHLMLYDKPKAPHFHPLNETVQPHFSLELSLERMTEIVDKLSKNKIPIIETPTTSSGDVTQLFFYDFDANMIEICHFTGNINKADSND